MTILYTILAQIILESLPISSSAHLLILPLPVISKNVEEFIHVFTLMVLSAYFGRQALCYFQQSSWHQLIQFFWYLLVANGITTLLYGLIKWCTWLWLPLPVGLCITMLLLLSTWWLKSETPGYFSYQKAIIIGFVQGCALLPGISRLASTVVVGRWLALSSPQSFFFSCALQYTLCGAGVLKSIASMYIHHDMASLYIFFSWPVAAILFGAMIIAYYMLALTQYLLYKHLLWCVGIYMIIPLLISLMR